MNSRINQKMDILEQVFSHLKNHFSKDQQKNLLQFIQSIYRDVAISDITQMSQVDLCGLTVSLWRHIQQYSGSTSEVEVFNPDVERDEWQSPHTVIAILCRNIPFVIDTVRLTLSDDNIKLHRVFYSELASNRNEEGKLLNLSGDESNELLIYFEIDHTSSKTERSDLALKLKNILADVNSVVNDFSTIKCKVKEAIAHSIEDAPAICENTLEEERTYLDWLLNNHFTFLGYDEFVLVKDKGKLLDNTQLGLFQRGDFEKAEQLVDYGDFLDKNSLLHFSKGSQRAMVHRPAYPDVIYVKRFDKEGNVIGGCRFIGLYTSNVYNGTPINTPVVRKKLENILAKSGFSRASHYHKELSQILFTYPMEDLLLCDEESLLRNCMDILHVQERNEIKLFMREEGGKQFVIAMVYVPRDVYNTEIRLKFEELICRTLDVVDSDFQTYLSESNLARVRFVFRLNHPLTEALEVDTLEARMKQIAKRWKDELQDSLIEHFGEEQGIQLNRKYAKAFPSGYSETFGSRVAVTDIERIETLYADNAKSMTLSFYRSMEANSSELKIKLFHQDGALLLSDLIPVLENLGLKVADEYPYEVRPLGEKSFWLYDFTLIYEQVADFDPVNYQEAFADAFLSVWYGKAENDAFNKLILGAGIRWRDVAMLRAFARYIKQIRFGFSQDYIAQTLLNHGTLVKDLVDLFTNRFHPDFAISIEAQQNRIDGILKRLDDVSNLNEDRIIRKYVELIMATLRTNYYQVQDGADAHNYMSFKFDHSKITDIPLPKLAYEIFVYSPDLEGVHLRGGKVARGGLRWSDRLEDFRTEVLGLVKAQQVKNAVIVPVGAKGGFVAKKLTQSMSREAFIAEGIRCYKMFISGLLDITDNLEQGDVVPPQRVVRYDGDDPYLVVAADKGTATFSDIANELACNRGFWLGDAFASGGSNGYDHKKMGITARGAWRSVQRHFREFGIDVQTQPVSVIGIGDMGGDVFGNGMLSSECIALLGAFNHMHIFIDPNPDNLSENFKERQRLFDTPRTSWADYEAKLISKGGGVFERSAKSIGVSAEMKARFGILEDQVTPTQLITYLLKAQVDLLWNGGIGTYVKASHESHGDVGDKANDVLRINGKELRCRVIGEGGNLGMTQSARIEYSRSTGGSCFTDAIDNAGGVNCSDLEVNIKILLDELVAKGDLTVKQRNVWLEKMTTEVADIVLGNNYRQAQSISIAYLDGFKRVEEFRRLIAGLEDSGKLNRALEYIPNEDVISERKNLKYGLSRPVMSVLISYGKNEMKEELSKALVSDDGYLLKESEKIFPQSLVKKYKKEVHNHRLVTEIVATQITNDIFNMMGITFVHRLMESTGCCFLDLAKSWVAARDIFGFDELLEQIEALDHKVPCAVQSQMVLRVTRMVRHATRWLIRNNRTFVDTAALVALLQKPLQKVSANIESLLVGESVEQWQSEVAGLIKEGVPKALAQKVASSDQMYTLLGVISVASKLDMDLNKVATAYFQMGDMLKLSDVSKQLNKLTVSSHWSALAREAMRDDLEWQQQRITLNILQQGKAKDSLEVKSDLWHQSNKILVDRWYRMARDMLATNEPEFSMYQVAIRELLDLSQASSK